MHLDLAAAAAAAREDAAEADNRQQHCHDNDGDGPPAQGPARHRDAHLAVVAARLHLRTWKPHGDQFTVVQWAKTGAAAQPRSTCRSKLCTAIKLARGAWGTRTMMVAREGSGQSLLMYTNAFWLLAHTAPLSKLCPAVRLAAVSLASGGPALNPAPCSGSRGYSTPERGQHAAPALMVLTRRQTMLYLHLSVLS